MDQSVREMQHAQITGDRVLHMSDLVRDHLEKMRAFADTIGQRAKLEEHLETLRTFGGAGEKRFKTTLYTDVPFRCDEWNVIARVLAYNQRLESWQDWFTIGLIFHQRSQEWDLHS